MHSSGSTKLIIIHFLGLERHLVIALDGMSFLLTFGDNGDGALGHGGTKRKLTPQVIPGLSY